ncbi:MAG: N-formylglutamate amidohydrolase [Rhodospirillales bacterium]
MNQLSRPGDVPTSLVGPGDPPVFEILNPEGRMPLQLVCDHASRRVPAGLGDLGLSAEHFARHIAYDIGAAEVTRRLSAALDAPAVVAGYSRLVIDLNRPPGHPESIPEISDATEIPGNHGLSEAQQRERVEALFAPYHDAVNDSLAHLWRRGKPPVLFSVHSFTAHYGDDERPWDVGVLWNRDSRLARPLIEKLSSQGFSVGDNLPYSGIELAYTIDLHGGAAGLANCVVEINQDHVLDDDGVRRWAAILAEAVGDILRRHDLHHVQQY